MTAQLSHATAALPAPDGSGAATTAIADALFQVIRAHHALRARLTDGSEGELTALILLTRLVLDGPRRSGELAEQMCADPSTVSRQAASLVRVGLVERRADPADGRASILVPTAAGRARAEHFLGERSQVIGLVTADWTDADREQFGRLLNTYAAGLERHRDAIAAGLHLDVFSSAHSTKGPQS